MLCNILIMPLFGLGVWNYNVNFLREFQEKLYNHLDVLEFVSGHSLLILHGLPKPYTLHVRRVDPHVEDTRQFNLAVPEEVEEGIRKHEPYLINGPLVVSFHLGFSAVDVGKMYVGYCRRCYAVSKPLSREETLSTINRSLDIIRQYFKNIGVRTRLALENLDYYPDYFGNPSYKSPYHWVCDPDFINEIFDQNPDFWLLLDIGHAQITAITKYKATPSTIKEKTIDYIFQLPLEKTVEIHVNGITWDPKKGVLIDSHKDLCEWEHLDILGCVLDQRGVNPIVIIYEPRVLGPKDLGWFSRDFAALTDFLKDKGILESTYELPYILRDYIKEN